MPRELKDTIWLVISPERVEKMTKTPPDTTRGRIAVKVLVTVPIGAFQPPVLQKELRVEDWRDGTELGDMDLSQGVITQAEADLIVQRRLAKMADILRERGAVVTWPEPEPDAVPQDLEADGA
jgi:hypothetical protein